MRKVYVIVNRRCVAVFGQIVKKTTIVLYPVAQVKHLAIAVYKLSLHGSFLKEDHWGTYPVVVLSKPNPSEY